LEDNSVLQIDTMSRSNPKQADQPEVEMRLKLNRGRLAGAFGAKAVPVSCEVEFTNCVARLRKGSFRIESDRVLSVARGTALVVADKGKSITVPPDHRFIVPTGAIEPLPPEWSLSMPSLLY
jgi:hypothetical protein